MNSFVKKISMIFLAFLGWILRKASDDRHARDDAEKQLAASRKYFDAVMEIESDHEKIVQEINAGDVPDDRVMQLLSNYPSENETATGTQVTTSSNSKL